MALERSDLIAELRQLGNQIERAREKLGRASSKRETNASQRKLEELRKLHHDRERDLDRLNAVADREHTAVDEAEKRQTAVAGELASVTETVAPQLDSLQDDKTNLVAERALVVARLPSIAYRRYESIRVRRPVAVARMDRGTCQGCHVSLTPMIVQKVREQRELQQCPTCNRILFEATRASAAMKPGSSRATTLPTERTLPVAPTEQSPSLGLGSPILPLVAALLIEEVPPLTAHPSEPVLPSAVDERHPYAVVSSEDQHAELLVEPTADPDKLEDRVRELIKLELVRPVGQLSPKRHPDGSRFAYERSPHVKAWVLKEARGRCNLCECAAPFKKSDGAPYLEVHHVWQLAEGGPDTPENAVAVCANCHRRLHHGADRDEQRLRLYGLVGRLVRYEDKRG